MGVKQEEQVAVVGTIPISWSREMVERMVAILRVREARLATKGTFILATWHRLTDLIRKTYNPDQGKVF